MNIITINPFLSEFLERKATQKLEDRMSSMLTEIQKEEEEINRIKKTLLPVFESVVLSHGKFGCINDPLRTYHEKNIPIFIDIVEDGEWGCIAGEAYFFDDGEFCEAICNIEEVNKVVEMTFDTWVRHLYYKEKEKMYKDFFVEINGERMYI